MAKVNKINSEINLVKTSIHVKYKSFDIMNKQLMLLIDAAGGKELDPNEIKVYIL